ncbi:Retinol dehydrogenase 8 [Nibea albiflora]|uniref:Retinol dehydrogenase 8 n=1 Tax=Nibea albiflora TaxID=240163 RepID=A0ACB7FK11_NIBAL|nr:Retinol dehydrogenase 8 [Nibea albiflora]
MRDLKRKDKLLEAAGDTYGSTLSLAALDVCSDESVKQCINGIEDRRVDILINNAGIGMVGPVESISIEDMQKVFETNFFGVVRMIKEVMPDMKTRKEGHIIVVTSVMGLQGVVFNDVYTASKFAIEGFCECLAVQLLRFNIRLSMIEPGPVHTEFEGKMIQEVIQKEYPGTDPDTLYHFKTIYLQSAINIFETLGQTPDDIARCIKKVIEASTPRFHNLTNPLYTPIVALKYADETGTMSVQGFYHMLYNMGPLLNVIASVMRFFKAVRKHVRSGITPQKHEGQKKPEITSNPRVSASSLTLSTNTNGTPSGVPQCQARTQGPAHPETSIKNQVNRFLLSSDAACPQTPDSSHDAARDHRPRSALRLRSRRSRLLLEKRIADAGRSSDKSQEGREQSEKMDAARIEESEKRVKTEGTEVVNESEELFTGSELESSPSLLLTHWNTGGQTETGIIEGKEIQGGQEQREKETELKAGGKGESESTHSEVRGQDGGRKATEGGEDAESSGQRDGKLCEDSSNKHIEQNTGEKLEKNHSDTVEINEERGDMVGGEQNVKGGSLLDSCTLVEGLLFPAEYYVRTTRRMTSSQSQPDMQAVILSQLNVGRQRRSRGRGRGLNSNARDHQRPDQQSQTDFASLTSPSVGLQMESQVTDTSELNGQSSGEVSDQISACQIDTDACFTPTVTTARPGRGRGRRRGRGRGRPQTPRCSLSLDTHLAGLRQTSDDHQPTSSPGSSFPADGPKPCFIPGEADPVPHNPEPASSLSTATQPSSGANGAQSSSASGHQVYPIFLKSSKITNRSTQMSRVNIVFVSCRHRSWRSLLLPSSSPAQTPLLPLPSLSLGSPMNSLINFDIPQDFHLPDDQFASLKLHKLRQVAVESGVEHFTSPSYNTRRSVRRSETCISGSDPVTPLSLPLSLTPTITKSPQPIEAKQAATQSKDFQNVSMEHTLGTEESRDSEIPGEQQGQTNTASAESASVVQDCTADCLDQYKQKDNASCELSRRVESASVQPQGSGGQVGLITEETAEEHMMRCTHTLEAPAGGSLVDACCLPGSSGGLCVAAAGKWAVCLWSQTSASDWNLTHTWAFNEPVINVFPVPDAAGLICVTLGRLEIREVRMLSCSSLLQVLLCEGLVQAAVGVSKSRVVTSAHLASGFTLQVFTLSDGGSTPCSQPLVSPGVCVGALAPVDGLSDALIGTDEDRRLFIWNLKTGQLLQKIILGDSLTHTSCLRGYSYCGVLFVLLQHQWLTPLGEEKREATAKDQMFLDKEEVEDRKKTVLFSLLAINPLSGKSALATQLYPPKAWSGRLCEADVSGCSVVGLSQSGCACVWELGHRAAPRMVWAPESEGWQLARWGGGGMLVTGHHNGDVTLHCNRASQTSLCRSH